MTAKLPSTAAHTRLEDGQSSISRNRPRFDEKAGVWVLDWKVRLHNGTLKTVRSKGATRDQCVTRAKRREDELLNGSGNGPLRGSTPIEVFFDTVVKPKISTAVIEDSTKRRYMIAYNLLMGRCRLTTRPTSKPRPGETSHKHEFSLRGKRIVDALDPQNLIACLDEVGRLHGVGNVKHCENVLGRYVVDPLIVLGLLPKGNPMPTVHRSLNLTRALKPPVKRGGVGLTLDEYHRVQDYLLTLDVTNVTEPRRGRATLHGRVVERVACRDIVLTQMTTGLRINEIANLSGNQVHYDVEGNLLIAVSGEDNHTKRGRAVPVLVPEVSQFLRPRYDPTQRQDLTPETFIFPNTTFNIDRPWQPRTRDRKIADFYIEMAEKLDMPLFLTERGHMWRATVNTLLVPYMDEAMRTAMIGNTADVNRQHYTAAPDPAAVVRLAAVLRPATVAQESTDLQSDR